VELNIYSSGLPLKKGDGRGIIRGVGGISDRRFYFLEFPYNYVSQSGVSLI
jgi:hypothetical protein